MLNDAEFNREFSKGIVQLMTELVAPLNKRIEELEAREVKHGRDGKDADPVEVAKIVLQSIQLPKDGKDGRDGKDAEPVNVDDIVSRVVALVPAPKDGAPGRDGIDGKGEKGEDGKDADPVEVAKIVLQSIELPKDGRDGKDAEVDIDAIVARAAALIPAPKDGVSPDIADVAALILKSIKLPKDGETGPQGKDGIGIASTIIDRDGNLVITKTDGTVQNVGAVVGRDGAPGAPGTAGKDGEPGRDGFGFDDMEAMDDPLRFGFAFKRGKDIKEFWYNKPTLADFDHEIYRAGTVYPRGAVVSNGGSLFICKQETSEKPEASKHWRLAVKRGRDGKDGERGPPGPIGPKGENGRMVGFDGRTL